MRHGVGTGFPRVHFTPRLHARVWQSTYACLLLAGACADGQGEHELAPPSASEQPSAVQALDLVDLTDGDAELFRRADHSQELLHGRRATHSDLSPSIGSCNEDARVLLGLVSLDACIGADLFFRESFGGNGRTCGTCHAVTENYTIGPDHIATLEADDPLFVADLTPELATLEKSQLLREFGLFVVNADGTDDLANKYTMRSASHLLSLATSMNPGPLGESGLTPDGSTNPPVQRLGWSGDGAPGQGTLREFAIGAITQHAPRTLARKPHADFFLPTDTQLAQLEKFQLGLGRKNEIELTDVHLTDAVADRGRRNFLFGPARSCEDCHRNAGANNVITPGKPELANSNFNVGTELGRIPLLDELGVPFDGGFGLAPFDTDGDGVNDAFGDGRFASQPLIEAADTGPFFHTNSAKTIEDAIRFYTTPEFGSSPVGQSHAAGRDGGPFKLTEGQIGELGRFLRVLNASFNCQQALVRLQAVFEISEAFGNRYITIQRALLELTNVELEDALDDLSQVDALNQTTQALLEQAMADVESARSSLYRDKRKRLTRQALLAVSDANEALGTGMVFEIGESTLLF